MTHTEEIWSRGVIGSKKLGTMNIIRGGYYAFFPEKEYLTVIELYDILSWLESENEAITDKRLKKQIEREEKALLICRGYGVYR